MFKKNIFLYFFLSIFIMNFLSLFSMFNSTIQRSLRFRSSKSLERFMVKSIENEIEVNRKCSICHGLANEEDSIEFLSCRHMVHVRCAIDLAKKYGDKIPLWYCLICEKNKN